MLASIKLWRDSKAAPNLVGAAIFFVWQPQNSPSRLCALNRMLEESLFLEGVLFQLSK
jgi:hypothetical protein